MDSLYQDGLTAPRPSGLTLKIRSEQTVILIPSQIPPAQVLGSPFTFPSEHYDKVFLFISHSREPSSIMSLFEAEHFALISRRNSVWSHFRRRERRHGSSRCRVGWQTGGI